MNISGNNKIAGVFIKNIIPGSPADKCNVLQVGDRILAVDDTNLKDSTHQYAVSVIKNAGLKIRLVVERFNKWVSVYREEEMKHSLHVNSAFLSFEL